MCRSAELMLRISPDLLAALDKLAGVMGRSRSELTEEALAQYFEAQRWQAKGISAAIEEADQGEPGIAHERVAAWLDSWGSDDELPPPGPDG